MNSISDQAADGIEDAVRRSTVAIVTGSGAQKWRGLGTGALVRRGTRHLILTAEHVIGTTDHADLRVFLPQDAPPRMVDRDRLRAVPGVPTAGLKPFAQIELGPPVVDGGLDLAAIEVGAELAERPELAFTDWSADVNTPPPGTRTVVMGFPHELTRLTQANERVAFGYTEWSEIVPPRTGLRDFNPDIHFLMGYQLAETHPEANARGLSGGAVWFRRAPTPMVWHPNVDVAGVTISWYEEARLLQAVRREAIDSFFEKNFD